MGKVNLPECSNTHDSVGGDIYIYTYLYICIYWRVFPILGAAAWGFRRWPGSRGGCIPDVLFMDVVDSGDFMDCVDFDDIVEFMVFVDFMDVIDLEA